MALGWYEVMTGKDGAIKVEIELDPLTTVCTRVRITNTSDRNVVFKAIAATRTGRWVSNANSGTQIFTLPAVVRNAMPVVWVDDDYTIAAEVASAILARGVPASAVP